MNSSRSKPAMIHKLKLTCRRSSCNWIGMARLLVRGQKKHKDATSETHKRMLKRGKQERSCYKSHRSAADSLPPEEHESITHSVQNYVNAMSCLDPTLYVRHWNRVTASGASSLHPCCATEIVFIFALPCYALIDFNSHTHKPSTC